MHTRSSHEHIISTIVATGRHKGLASQTMLYSRFTHRPPPQARARLHEMATGHTRMKLSKMGNSLIFWPGMLVLQRLGRRAGLQRGAPGRSLRSKARTSRTCEERRKRMDRRLAATLPGRCGSPSLIPDTIYIYIYIYIIYIYIYIV